MKTKQNKNVLITIIILISVACIAFIFSFVLPKYIKNMKQDYLRTKVPTVKSSVVSGTDKKQHTVITNFTVDLGVKYSGKITPDMLHSKISAIMETLDYDTINSADGLDYIKENVKKGLAEEYQVDALLGIYVTDLDSGTIRISNDKPTNSDKNSKLGKLFPGLNR